MNASKWIAIALIISSAMACNGSNSKPTQMTRNYSGNWEAVYNLAKDDCFLVSEEHTGFTDEASINQAGTVASVNAIGSLLITDSAEVREDGTLLAEVFSAGDIFGDGNYCELQVSVSYDLVDTDVAESLFYTGILCNPGTDFETYCESTGVGSAERVHS
ncbi:MAG: hypothetical protein KDD62_09505 [Bdellovibrionales bacterium]|nr:hypothetical protein [Bdellovibrionales bacterium]